MKQQSIIHDSFTRFLKRQAPMYECVLRELQAGRKEHCWMWYIFPQMRGLARSRTAFVFGLVDAEHARAYLAHPVLGPRLIACCEAILTHKDKTARDILGEVDAMKLRACATLFACISEENSVFHRILEQFFDGSRDLLTLGLISGTILDITPRKFLVGVDFK